MAESIYAGRVRIRGCALVVKNNQLLLLHQRLPTRKLPVWLPPGGEILLGETAQDAAKRETFEETGIKIKPSRLVAVHEFIEPPFHAIEFYFISEFIEGNLKIGTDPELTADEQQILNVSFFSFHQLPDLAVVPSFLKDFHQLLKYRDEGLVKHISPKSNL